MVKVHLVQSGSLVHQNNLSCLITANRMCDAEDREH